MGHRLAIDFGTTNTVIARWDAQNKCGELVHLGDKSVPVTTIDCPPLIPSLLYIHDWQVGQVSYGHQVREQQLDYLRDNRLFRNFKRGIVTMPAPEPRHLDGVMWSDKDAGRLFMQQLLSELPDKDIDQLVLTAPVTAFEDYLQWLSETVEDSLTDQIHIVDESTAAALGYAVTEPGAIVLVFDFGGGTLDLSLVQLPDSREKTGGILRRLLQGHSQQRTARVIAKAGRIMGGSDIDQWLLADILRRLNLTPQDIGLAYPALLTACEQAKIALSSATTTTMKVDLPDAQHMVTVTQDELEALLQQHGFYTALRHIIDKVMHVARQRGIFKEDIRYVLMVGGASLMPSVQALLARYFTDIAIRADKPFTAIAEGALQVAAGLGLEDYLVHSYGLRHFDPHTQMHHYDEIIPMGSRYPMDTPIEVLLGAAHEQQQAIEFIVGEIDTDAATMLEVKYENGQAVFVAQGGDSTQQIVPLNEASHHLAHLVPVGVLQEERLKASFIVNANRQLQLTVKDLKTNKYLLRDVIVTTVK